MSFIVTTEHLKAMDHIRSVGAINPLAAGPILMSKFDLSGHQASEVLKIWCETFSNRHANGQVKE